MDQIQKEIDSFYAKYASKEGISIAEAKKRASKLDMEEFSRKAKKYVEEKNFSKQANDEMRLYNLTMKVNRLELLKAQIGLELVAGFDELQRFYEEKLTDRTMEEFQRQAGILGMTVADNAALAAVIVNASFKNATFSERIWMHQDLLRAELDKLLQTGLIQGRNPRELARMLRGTFDASIFNSERLLRTELARVQTEAQRRSYIENGFDQYTYITCGDGKVCSECKPRNGKHFNVDKMTPGDNAPPMHPLCRCSTAAYIDDKSYDEWLEGYKDHGLSYADWKAMQTAGGKHDIMNMYLKNVKKKQGKDGVAVLDSYTALPKKLRKAFEKVKFDFGYNASACDIKNRTIRVGKNATKEQIDHELGHLIEHEILTAADVKAYKEYLVEGLGIGDIRKEIYHDNVGNPVEVYLLKSDKLVSEYQGMLYVENLRDALNENGTINIDCLGEVISEPFRLYCKNQLDDKVAVEMIERAIK